MAAVVSVCLRFKTRTFFLFSHLFFRICLCHITQNGNQNYARVDLKNVLGMEKISPKASLTHHIQPIVYV